MKRSNLILLSAANSLISLLDTSGELWEERFELKQQLKKVEYLKKQNDEEITAACNQIQEVLHEK